MMQVVPNSERYYCRVEGCHDWTWLNTRFGYCEAHARGVLNGESYPEKAGFPPAGYKDPSVGDGRGSAAG